MGALGVGGVSMSFLGCMAWGYGIISGRFGRCFLVIPDLRWDDYKIRFWHDLW
jgi:hypothetical protein